MNTMSNNCKIEFYFKRKDLEKLLADNKNAHGIIICQSIKPRISADKKSKFNAVEISAYAVHREERSMLMVAESKGVESVDGCPYPPGCMNETTENQQ